VIDNRAGGGTVIGTDVVARATVDGYTLLITTGTHAVNASLIAKLPFDPVRSFDPVTLLGTAANVLLVHPSIPAKTVREFVSLAKSRPGAINYSSSGNGGTGHLAMEMFKQQAGVSITHIPYKGAGPAVTALVAGEVETSITNLIAALPQIRANRMRALAVTSSKRSTALPDTPTIAESGFPGFEVINWYGVLAPAGTPRTVITRLNNEITRIVKTPDTRDRLISYGLEVVTSSPEDYAAFRKADLGKWAKIVKDIHLKYE